MRNRQIYITSILLLVVVLIELIDPTLKACFVVFLIFSITFLLGRIIDFIDKKAERKGVLIVGIGTIIMMLIYNYGQEELYEYIAVPIVITALNIYDLVTS